MSTKPLDILEKHHPDARKLIVKTKYLIEISRLSSLIDKYPFLVENRILRHESQFFMMTVNRIDDLPVNVMISTYYNNNGDVVTVYDMTTYMVDWSAARDCMKKLCPDAIVITDAASLLSHTNSNKVKIKLGEHFITHLPQTLWKKGKNVVTEITPKIQKIISQTVSIGEINDGSAMDHPPTLGDIKIQKVDMTLRIHLGKLCGRPVIVDIMWIRKLKDNVYGMFYFVNGEVADLRKVEEYIYQLVTKNKSKIKSATTHTNPQFSYRSVVADIHHITKTKANSRKVKKSLCEDDHMPHKKRSR